MNDLVMLVDDESNVLSALTRALIDEPFDIITASSGNEALELMEGKTIKAIVSDERMVGMQGSELLAEVKRRSPETVRILLTGHATLDAAMRAVNVGEIYRFFLKPWDDTEVRFALMSARLGTTIIWTASCSSSQAVRRKPAGDEKAPSAKITQETLSLLIVWAIWLDAVPDCVAAALTSVDVRATESAAALTSATVDLRPARAVS